MSDEVDHDAVAWARALLVGRRASTQDIVRAYRVLAAWDPRAYALKLTRALYEHSWHAGTERLGLLEEAVAVGRSVPLTSTRDIDVFAEVLDSYQFALYEAGRRTDGFEVSEELGALSRRGSGSRYRLDVWARCLAEAGRHAEAADVCAELTAVSRQRDATAWSGELWGFVSAIAQAHAAGRTARAHEGLAEVIEVERGYVEHADASERVLLYLLMYQAWMLRTDGRMRAAVAVDRDAVAFLGRIVRAGGERKVWSGYQSTLWTTLLAASSVASERSVDGPLPPFGWSITDWSPDLRDAYCAGIAAITEATNALTGLPTVARVHRQVAVRTAVRHEWRSGTRWAQRCRPAFDDSVEVARRCHDAGAVEGSALLAQALTDRAGLAAADGRFEAALNDLTEATHLHGQ
ncbi:hypothetical protein [Polymorphospora rubra]|uniref:Uncharacterized protein n=1 Tax=Polymorphospora rubra TaxID=338584 RepID=A0A810MV19_9ACTN|nr:hypothetical protein [Polymorphospora rubra]BCJ64852.1 hypothetical protein Prubr_18730 [Polymorphospora rubra]